MATIIYEGLEHSSLGSATLSSNAAQSELTVGGLTTSGNDGVSVNLLGKNRFHLYHNPINLTPGVEFRSTTRGKTSTGGSVVLFDSFYGMEGSDKVLKTDVQYLAGFTTTLKVYKSGVLQYQSPFPFPSDPPPPPGIAWVVVGIIILAGVSHEDIVTTSEAKTTNPDGSVTTTVTTTKSSRRDWDLNPFGTYRPPGSGLDIPCDLLEIEAVKITSASVLAPTLSSLDFTAKGLPQFVIGNEIFWY